VARTKKAGSAKADTAAEVWQTIVGFFIAHREEHMRKVHELGLTPGDMKAFLVLDTDEPRAMGELAESWGCDASNVTWMVDRLEERGFVERRAHASDRRVKTVVLTPAGQKMKVLLLERLGEPPPDLLLVERTDLETLRDALALLPEHAPLGHQQPPVGERRAG
jgi:DNA-binding MarR family transcriptional regulator